MVHALPHAVYKSTGGSLSMETKSLCMDGQEFDKCVEGDISILVPL